MATAPDATNPAPKAAVSQPATRKSLCRVAIILRLSRLCCQRRATTSRVRQLSPKEFDLLLYLAERDVQSVAAALAVVGTYEGITPDLAEAILKAFGNPDDLSAIFVSDQDLSEGVAVAWAMLMGLGVFLIVVAVLAADGLGRSVVRPVTKLSEAAHEWGRGNLEAWVEPAGPADG